ncbi:MAG: NADAR family protein [Alphaproteobacteria bacterium]|nr:NADAR family protein [Alphaproteobacteria bacterium]MBQ8631233.1 NADAR family protein [Alphaproteobacteria bacterium]
MKTQNFQFKTSEKEAIVNFNEKEFNFLSNAFPEKIIIQLDGVIFNNVETAYQAAKVTDPMTRKKISRMSPSEAKGFVTHPTTPCWNDTKYKVMFNLLWQKFYGNDDMKQKLLATGDREIVKLNGSGDIYWGVCKIGDDYIGENNIGEILMNIREKLRNLA